MTYAWTCKKCGHSFEEHTSYDKRSSKCPLCKGELKQQFTKAKAKWNTPYGR